MVGFKKVQKIPLAAGLNRHARSYDLAAFMLYMLGCTHIVYVWGYVVYKARFSINLFAGGVKGADISHLY